MGTQHGMVFLTIRQLGALLRSREVSPVELTRLFLERLEELGPAYNAVVTLTAERALSQAQRAEQELGAGEDRGRLHGIPYGAKDLLATSGGIPTTWGTAPFRHQTFASDATVVLRLEAAGAVLAAKLAMVELAGGGGYWQPNASFTGPGITPWDTTRWSGGSSSGSGAATRGGPGPFQYRLRDGWLHSRARELLRGLRPSPDVRTGEPPRGHGTVVDLGQARTHVPDRRRLRDRPRGDRRPRPRGSVNHVPHVRL